MKQRRLKFLLFFLSAIFIFYVNANAAVPHYRNSITLADSVKNANYLKAQVFVNLSPKEFTSLTGKKLNFLERLYFKTLQRKMRHELKNNPELLITQYYNGDEGKFKLDAVWFIVGAIIGPLAILFSFTSKQSKNKRASAILGCILFITWFGFFFVF